MISMRQEGRKSSNPKLLCFDLSFLATTFLHYFIVHSSRKEEPEIRWWVSGRESRLE